MYSSHTVSLLVVIYTHSMASLLPPPAVGVGVARGAAVQAFQQQRAMAIQKEEMTYQTEEIATNE